MVDYKMVNGKSVPLTDEEQAEHDARAAAWPALQAARQLIQQARVALAESDLTVLRCYENGVAVPAVWATYRASLRAIITNGSGALPARPQYPVGS